MILLKTLFVPPDVGNVGTWCAWNNNDQRFPFTLFLVSHSQALLILPRPALATPACFALHPQADEAWAADLSVWFWLGDLCRGGKFLLGLFIPMQK